jgi:hypothetical protein
MLLMEGMIELKVKVKARSPASGKPLQVPGMMNLRRDQQAYEDKAKDYVLFSIAPANKEDTVLWQGNLSLISEDADRLKINVGDIVTFKLSSE